MGESTATLIPIIAFLVFWMLINNQKPLSNRYKRYKRIRKKNACFLTDYKNYEETQSF